MTRRSLPTVLLPLVLLLLGTCTDADPGTVSPPEGPLAACGTCHVAPDPGSLPRAVWERTVLPEMGARMGMASMGYDPAGRLPPGEYALARAHGFYPPAPTLPLAEWEALRRYILDRAPDSLAAPPPLPLAPLESFAARPFAVEDRGGALISYLGRGPDGLVAGDGYGRVVTDVLSGDTLPRRSVRLPVVHYLPSPGGDLLLEIGNIYPTEARNGKLYRYHGDVPRVIADSLHRPVHLLEEDLDGDGQREIVVSEYGNYSGALTLLKPAGDGHYTRTRLLGLPGCTRTVATDLNGDGRTDLVVLHAQGDEGIDALYQRADGSFQRELLLRFPPVWGTSWFELADVDGDGHRDLITVHGDNADYSPLRKPYHGLRIHLNDGANAFHEAFFLPLPGATRVVARDFDADGDLDLAVACNFADYGKQPDASFVYLERTGAPHDFDFTARTTPLALDGRWLILEADDYDGDGDIDMALGSFTLNSNALPIAITLRWRDGRTDGLFLENLLRPAR